MSEKNISGITKIAVKGFKSIAEECSIDIRPLTILAGANSSGKSSIMQPLLMLKQTLEAPFDPGPLLIDGPNVQFTGAVQFLSKLTDEKDVDRFQVGVETSASDYSFLVTTIFKKGQTGIEIVKMMTDIKYPYTSSYSRRFDLDADISPEKVREMVETRAIPEGYDVLKRSRCFLGFESKDGNNFLGAAIGVKPDILHTVHLPGLRGNPERIYKRTSTDPLYPGTFEHYAASVIHEWQETKDKRLKVVADTLHNLGLTGHVGTQKISDVGIELQVGRLLHDKTDNTEMVNIADVGLGVSQILPVLVAVIVAEPGQLVYLEQPELHLHPRAQVALAQVLADAAKRGVRVVAETHSSLLLLGVQTLVAEGDLSPELVKLHWFTRREDGVTKVDSVDLDEAGTYGDWSMDFDDVSLNVQSRFLDAVDNVRFGDKETS